MTAAFEFYAEQAYLSFVKKLLDRRSTKKLGVEERVVSVLACAAAIEAMVNRLFDLQGALEQHQSLSLEQKIEILAKKSGANRNWGNPPWQNIKELIQVRNWLAHYKESWLGLMNSESQWVPDHNQKMPRFTPQNAFCTECIENYYRNIIAIVTLMANGLGCMDQFAYIQSEVYEPFVQTG